jgi:hypothetical protein
LRRKVIETRSEPVPELIGSAHGLEGGRPLSIELLAPVAEVLQDRRQMCPAGVMMTIIAPPGVFRHGYNNAIHDG